MDVYDQYGVWVVCMCVQYNVYGVCNLHMCIFMCTWSVGGYGCYIGCVSVCVVCVWQYGASAWHVECMPGRWSWVCMVYIRVGTQAGLAFPFGLCVCLYMLMPALARGVTSWIVSQLPHPISLPSSLLGTSCSK